jgi:1,4-dihydroxy-2-naphthoate octaprenyltransferase
MEKENKLSIWAKQTRANFLLLAVLLVAIGVVLSYKHNLPGHSIHIYDIFLVAIGVILTHASVNLFNEYSDFRTGIDQNTPKTPFSGGSNMLISGKTSPGSVLFAAIVTLSIAAIIGIYFSIKSNWVLLPVILMGALTIVGYTNFLTKIGLGELFSGLMLGSFVVIGTFIALTGSHNSSWSQLFPIEVVLISIPPGILTSLLLFLNQFPDLEADSKGGRNHLVIRLGRKKASVAYAIGVLLVFLIILLLPIVGISSYWIYLALLPLPIVLKTIQTTFQYYEDTQKLIPALGGNVITVLATDFLLAGSLALSICLN